MEWSWMIPNWSCVPNKYMKLLVSHTHRALLFLVPENTSQKRISFFAMCTVSVSQNVPLFCGWSISTCMITPPSISQEFKDTSVRIYRSARGLQFEGKSFRFYQMFVSVVFCHIKKSNKAAVISVALSIVVGTFPFPNAISNDWPSFPRFPIHCK